MFDLFRSREKSVRILLGALLLLVALSMLTYLVPNYGSGSNTSDTIVAEIGKEDVITLVEVQRLIQNTVRGRQLPPDLLPNYVPTMVDQLVTERALAYEAARLGFQVTDADLADTIRQSAPGLFQDGRFVGKDAYASMLAQQGVSIGEFESDLRRQGPPASDRGIRQPGSRQRRAGAGPADRQHLPARDTGCGREAGRHG